MKIFGPSKAEIWRQLSDQIGGCFVQGGLFKASTVEVHQKQWTITLDTCATFDTWAENESTYTRMRAPYVNKDGFRFTIYRKSVFSGLGKMLGMQDVEIGEPKFDDAFIIKGNDETKLRKMFGDRKIRQLIELQPKIYLTVRDGKGWFKARFPEGVNQIYFRAPGVVKDVERLKSLYELFAEILDHLCQIGSAYERDPGMVL